MLAFFVNGFLGKNLDMVKHAMRAAAAVSVAAVLSGCSALGLDFTEDKVQYESSNSRAPLEIPPDLDQVTRNDRYNIPSRPQIVSANAEAAKAQMEAEARGDAPAQVLPQTEVAKVVRDGSVRYVHVSEPPEKIWPLLSDFWASVGLVVKSQDATTGVMQTEWAENKANLPKDIIRATLGRAIDFVYDTGTRDQYRARMERADDGTTNIYITHRQMVEVLKGRQEDSTIWQPGPSDPELEAVMLTKLAQKLEQEFNPAAKPAEQAAVDELQAVKYQPMSEVINGPDGKPEAVVISEPFDRAWRRVGVALDRSGFEVVDRDRSLGLFMISYLDPDYEQQKKSEQGFFTNLFSKAKAVDPVQYRLRLAPEGDKTRVTVLSAEGRADETGVAPRILTLVGEATR